MAVGVPENDVFAAADTVLARGERPTVERVRLELGRGSPARVGALLDQWWEQLAARLRGETRLPGLPPEVAQAFVALWQQATTLAQAVVEQSLAAQRQVLAEEREALGALEARVRLEVVQARQQTAEAVTARQSIETRLADLEQLLTQRQAQIDDLREQREELLTQRDDAREQLVEVQQQMQAARHQAEQVRDEHQRYTREIEDRAYCEIDRAREESKALAAQLKTSHGRIQTLQQSMQAVQAEVSEARERRATALGEARTLLEQVEQYRLHQDDLQQRLQRREADLAVAREQYAAANARAETLAEQLNATQRLAAPDASRRSRKIAPKKS
ncbi:hypothetical protein PSCICF_20910 [Pseudomonas cichorii]|nr:DNA-binding protein [Pseudomonas cichorii]MBX8606431.1 DNA-binding protein [Pseudomonas cichorii]GFM55913.1 hypothetical protein PSCICF_20910 [Pseudomonas cichorii]GFM60156.1 hypothetical protein PSCICG_13160 [Pseudomonas cichorii]